MKKLLFVLLILSSYHLEVKSQQAVSLTLDEVIQKTISNSPMLKKLSLNDQKNSYELQAFNSVMRPKVDLEAQLGFNPILPTQRIPDFINGNLDETIPVQFGTFQNHQATLGVSKILYSKGIAAGREALKKSFDLNGAQTKKAKEDLVFSITKLYFQVQSIKFQESNINNSIAQIEKLIELSKAREKSGLGLAIDTDRLRLNINNLTSQREIILAQEQSLVNIINVLTGLPFDTKINFITKEYKSKDFLPSIDPKVVKSSTLDLLDLQKEVIKAQIESTLASNKPTLATFGNLAGQMLGNGAGDLFKGDRYSIFFVFGVQFKMPIYDGKQTLHKSNSAKIDLLQVDEDKKNFIQGIEQQYLQAYQSYFSNLKQLQIQKESVVLAQKIYDLTQDRYAQGITPLIDVIDAQKNLADAKNMIDITNQNITLNKVDLTYFEGNILDL